MAGSHEAGGRGPKTPDLQVGTAGASARARYDALRRRDDAGRRKTFGPLAPLVRLIAGPDESTEAWGRGADGEERIAAYLHSAVGGGVLLHDRSIPRRRSNLDHIAVVSSGIWVIDSKHYRGRVERRTVGGWFRSRPALYVARRDQTSLVAGALRQRALVAEVVGSDVPVQVALCFIGAEWPFFARPFTIDGVLVTWPRALARALGAPGGLGAAERTDLARRVAETFPPYRTSTGPDTATT
jgi:hypothetical protein